MTKGRMSSTPKLFCLHILQLLHNVKWCTMYRHYHLTRLLQMQPLQIYCQEHGKKNKHPIY